MKIKIAPLFLLSLASVFAAACVAPVDDAREADEAEEIGSAASAVVACGTTCPANEHPVTYQICSSACSPTCGPGIYNAVLCSPHGTTFQQCGLDCPAGWHSTGSFCRTACGACDASTPNAAGCQAD